MVQCTMPRAIVARKSTFIRHVVVRARHLHFRPPSSRILAGLDLGGSRLDGYSPSLHGATSQEQLAIRDDYKTGKRSLHLAKGRVQGGWLRFWCGAAENSFCASMEPLRPHLRLRCCFGAKVTQLPGPPFRQEHQLELARCFPPAGRRS